MPRYFLRLSYNGSGFSGWQIQENALTVQEVLNSKLGLLLRSQTETTGCGRTDTGVHASQFYAHFDTVEPISDKGSFLYSLNAMLPNKIAVQEVIPVHDDAHARFDAESRAYKYFISAEKNPFLNDFVYTNYAKFDIEAMNKACEILYEHKDFEAFSKSNTQVKTNNCEIKKAAWVIENKMLIFSITADRFLRGMVRAIVGTMLEIGSGKITPDTIERIIKTKNRSEAGASVPAKGLYLTSVKYPYINPVTELNFPF